MLINRRRAYRLGIVLVNTLPFIELILAQWAHRNALGHRDPLLHEMLLGLLFFSVPFWVLVRLIALAAQRARPEIRVILAEVPVAIAQAALLYYLQFSAGVIFVRTLDGLLLYYIYREGDGR